MNSRIKPETIAVVGGGMSGIAAALELGKSGRFQVTLLEKDAALGGLSSSYQWQDITCDRFYHVILSSDRHLIQLIKDLGLGPDLVWTSVRTGFFGEGELHSLSSVADFLRFPFLTFPQKIRMGWGILWSAALRNPSRLAAISSKVWLTGVFGSGAYESVWKPLLSSKLGPAGEEAPATFIWSTIKRLYGARSLIHKKEMMGHVRGGYHRILEAAQIKLQALDVDISTNCRVEKIIPGVPGEITVVSSSERRSYDRVLLTVPSPEVYRILDGGPQSANLGYLRDVCYLGVVCVLLVLKRRLSPYYVINLLDRTLPFTGIIESTNVVSPGELGGRHLIYLPKYSLDVDDGSDRDDAELVRVFLQGLVKVIPEFRETDVLHAAVFRERYVQPIFFAERGEAPPRSYAMLPNVFLANSAFIRGTPLNNEAILIIAQDAVKTLPKEKPKA
jgi:protoporphyrinogen oxidase